MIKKILFLFVLSLTTTAFCFGQDKSEYKKAIVKLVAVSGSEKTFKVAVNQMLSSIRQSKPEIPGEFWTTFSEEMLKTSMTDLVDLLFPIYQNHLSLADVNGIIAFYETPIGKKYAEKTPLITQESMAAGQEWGVKIGAKIIEQLKTKYN